LTGKDIIYEANKCLNHAETAFSKKKLSKEDYNLILHQTLLANVELAFMLSGVPKKERRRWAKEALEKVGLADRM